MENEMNKDSTINYFVSRFGLTIYHRPPIEILNINRKVMANCLSELGFITGAEIGVAAGEHAEILLSSIYGLNLYCIDPWVHYKGYNDYLGKTLKSFEVQAAERLKLYDGAVIVKKYSMDAKNDFDDESLDFVYIDGAHDYKNAVDDICEWYKKVKHGGILYGHDYKRQANGMNIHVVDAVNGFMYAYKIHPWFILGERGQSDGIFREGTRSWMMVKE